MSRRYNIEELMIRFFQEDIFEDELQELNTWINETPENKSHFFELKDIDNHLRHKSLIRSKEVEESWLAFHKKIEAVSSVSPQPKKRISISNVFKYAVIIAVTISLGLVIEKTYRDQPHEISTSNILYNEIRVEKGGKNTLLLSDGSKVVLNGSTTFKYPASFSGTNRKVYLDGEAYFEIAKDSLHPFIVHLKQQELTVMGTSFNIEAYSTDSYSIISLLSGYVSLTTYDKKGDSISNLIVKANQKAFFDNVKETVSLMNGETSLSKAWVNREYKFDNEPLSLITKRLEKYYGVIIHLEEVNLKDIRYTGTFSLDQTIQDVLRVINHDKQFIYKEKDKEIYLTTRK